MVSVRSVCSRLVCALLLLGVSRGARAQALDPAPPADDHAQMQMDMNMNMSPKGWQFMQDGQVLGLFNHQGGPRGDDEFKAPNWWMGMASRHVGVSELTLTGMFSLDPATVGRRGYRELFQVGEAVGGQPLVDRQHPHDFFMQIAAAWRAPIGGGASLTIAGGPVGEPALGPVAFMHRASASDNPLAPLGHHTFDSTHIAFGVVTMGIDRGAWTVEGSVFNGREPDEHRWDFDFGRMDSVSGRVWWRSGERWEFQASTGHLKDPEELHAGNVQRTTTSLSWIARGGDQGSTDFTAVTAGYGVNVTSDANRQAVFAEATRHVRSHSLFGRVEILQVEADLLLGESPVGGSAARPITATLGAFSFGAQRELRQWHGLELSGGAMATAYAVPDVLRATHGDHPLSFQLFVRLRPPAGAMGRMMNMRMGGQGHGI